MAGAPTDPGAQRFAHLDVSGRRRIMVRSVVSNLAWVAAIVAAYYVVPWDGGVAGSVVLRVVLALVLVVASSLAAVPSVRSDRFPVLRAVQVLSVVVALAIVLFASIYLLMSSNGPASFSEPLGHTDALYFSLTTSTTVGYGDINAKSEAARIVVMIHMVTNVVVLGVMAKVVTHAARERVQGR